jgi:hypothetical protein
VLLACLSAFTSSVGAAEAPKKRPGRYRTGRLYWTPALELHEAGLDTNVYYQATNTVQDFSATLIPSLEAALPLGSRLRLKGSGGLSMVYFARQDSERYVDRYGALGAEVDVGPFTFSGNLDAGRFKQLVDIEVNQRVEYKQDGKGVGVNVDVTRRLSGAYSRVERTYLYEPGIYAGGTEIRDSLDRTETVDDLELSFALTRRTAFVTRVDFIEDQFLRAPEESSVAESRRYLAGFNFGQKALFRGHLLAGKREYPTTGSGPVPPYSGLALTAKIEVPIGVYLQLGLLADRDTRYSVLRPATPEEQARNLYVLTSYRAELKVALREDLLGQLHGGFENADYVGGTLSDRLWEAGASLSKRFSRSLQIGTYVTWNQRNSQQPGASYSRVRLGVNAVFNP